MDRRNVHFNEIIEERLRLSTGANHQGAIAMLWLHFWELLFRPSVRKKKLKI